MPLINLRLSCFVLMEPSVLSVGPPRGRASAGQKGVRAPAKEFHDFPQQLQSLAEFFH
jgi:hypothetical protein